MVVSSIEKLPSAKLTERCAVLFCFTCIYALPYSTDFKYLFNELTLYTVTYKEILMATTSDVNLTTITLTDKQIEITEWALEWFSNSDELFNDPIAAEATNIADEVREMLLDTHSIVLGTIL